MMAGCSSVPLSAVARRRPLPPGRTTTRSQRTGARPSTAAQNSGNPLTSVRSFAYLIQDQEIRGNIAKLARSHYDLLLIDQTRSLKGEGRYDSARDVRRLKESSNSSGGKKLVVSYVDVGEAESYRWYWKTGWKVGRPEWIVAKDPDGWDENYPVKFWRPGWKDIMKTNIDRIIADGYDGVYLDWLEVYSFGPVARAAKREGLNPRIELTNFVRELKAHAEAKKPGFILIAQNGSELGRYPEYVELFDAVSQEAIFYDGGGDPDTGEKPGDVKVDPGLSQWYLANLRKWQKLGKPVFDVEYAQTRARVRRAYALGRLHKFKTYVTLRPLDRLTSTPPPGY